MNLKIIALLICLAQGTLYSMDRWLNSFGFDLSIDAQRYDSINKCKAVLQPLGAWYDPVPMPGASLDEELVMNSFWQKVKAQTAEEKSTAFAKVCDCYLYNDYTRHIHRYQLSAACFAGIDPKHELMEHSLVSFVLFNDYPLVQLMLEKGVSANSVAVGMPAISNAKTIAMAALLKKHGANFNVNLLHYIFSCNRSTKLIGYFIANGVSPYEEDSRGNSALVRGINPHILDSESKDEVRERMRAFLDAGVPQEKIQEAFDSGKANKEYLPIFQQIIAQRAELAAIASATADDANSCFICLDNPPSVNLTCVNKHPEQVCFACLGKLRQCPLCRNDLRKI